jgi:GcrA cell cycle regulator
MEWSEDVIAKLRALWSEGLSTAEIGRRLNISKNAVVGKAHRLNLPPRPSPIRRTDGAGAPARPPAPRRAQGPTLPPLAAAAMGVSSPALRPIVSPPKQSLRATPCCWPIGEPGKPSFHFCGTVSVAGKPYCEEHAAIAYVRIRDRREDAA